MIESKDAPWTEADRVSVTEDGEPSVSAPREAGNVDKYGKRLLMDTGCRRLARHDPTKGSTR